MWTLQAKNYFKDQIHDTCKIRYLVMLFFETENSIRKLGLGNSSFMHQFVQHFGEGNGNPLQYSCLENPVDGGAWWTAIHGVVKSRTRLREFTFTFHFHALEKEVATHSSVLAWRIPGTWEPGGLLSVGSHRVGHNWSYLAAAAAFNIYSILIYETLLF